MLSSTDRVETMPSNRRSFGIIRMPSLSACLGERKRTALPRTEISPKEGFSSPQSTSHTSSAPEPTTPHRPSTSPR